MRRVTFLTKAACIGLILLGYGSVADAALVTTTRSASSSATAGDLTISCQADEVVSGGGYKFIADTANVLYNAPIGGTQQGWTIRYTGTPTQSTLSFLAVVWAVCMKQQ
ncbi:hypothetical protein FHW84_001140 [Dyella sp. SG562]|uniref:hypothetical protein n=1 Tax=Dyella TaxID=231454 RepID=UPI0014215145|nr:MULTISPECIES: hypothetical protein [unclassified Dyella]NII72574.1 hypothetical protein [Dyella sp. SG562]NKJ21897.1 hypothetical protein [Dyella sp. SG609]